MSCCRGTSYGKEGGRTITRVRVDSLEKTEDDPDVDGKDVQVVTEHAVEDGTKDRASTEDKDFSWVSVFCSQTERSGVLVMNLVDVFVEWSPVQCLVGCPG